MNPTETVTILRKFAQWLRADKYLWGASLPGVSAEVGAAIESAVEMIDRLEAAEKERDSYKFVFSEYSEKTEWVQRGVDDGTVSTKYLGWHRADVMSDLLSAAEKDRDALRAKISDLTINVEYLGNLKKSYEELIGELQEECDTLRAKVNAMEKQKPVCVTTKAHLAAMENGADRYIVGRDPVFSTRGENDVPLYLAPGAKGE